MKNRREAVRSSIAGALAGSAALAVIAAIDSYIVLRATGAFWVTYLDILRVVSLYAVVGSIPGAVIGGLHATLVARRRVQRSAYSDTFAALIFVGGAALACFQINDVGLSLDDRGDLLPYALAIVAILILSAGLLFFLRAFESNSTRRPHIQYLGFIAASLVAPMLLRALDAQENEADGSVGAVGAVGSAEKMPNMVLLVMDTTRRDGLSLYGGLQDSTPVLDRIGSESLVFERAYSAAPWTPPSHASLFTGLYPSHHGTSSSQISLAPPGLTLAEVLRERGYETIFVSGKSILKRSLGWTAGFEKSVVANIEDRVGFIYQRLIDRIWVTSNTPMLIKLAKRLTSTDRGQTKPFFLFLNLNDPHSSYRELEPYFSRYSEGIDYAQVDLEKVRRCAKSELYLADISNGRVSLNAEELNVMRAMYLSEVSYMDAELESLFDHFERIAETEQVLCLVTSDHGEMFGEFGRMSHGPLLYDELIRVPLLLWSKPSLGVGRIEDLVSLVDVYPTFCALAGDDSLPEREDGALTLLNTDPDRVVFSECWKGRGGTGENFRTPDLLKSVLSGRFKLTWSYPNELELFDMGNAGEQIDLSAALPADAARLLDLIESSLGLSPDHPQTEADQEHRDLLRKIGYL